MPINGYPYSDEAFQSRVERIIDRVEAELGQAVSYVDSVVVPEVRREAGNAARLMAGHLERLADRLNNPRMNPNLHPYRKQGL
jgi:hypothetical protein